MRFELNREDSGSFATKEPSKRRRAAMNAAAGLEWSATPRKAPCVGHARSFASTHSGVSAADPRACPASSLQAIKQARIGLLPTCSVQKATKE